MHITETGSFTLNEGETLTLPAVKLTPRYGTLSLQSSPTGADVFLNGQNRGKTPLNRLRLDSGQYELEMRLSMYHVHKEQMLIKEGEEKNLNLNMQPAFGELVINSSPESGATIFIDDREVGKTPYRNNKQPSGKFLVRVEKDFWFAVTREVEISDAKTTTENFTLPPNFGTLNVKSDGAEIFLDDKRVGFGNYQERLKPGRYTVTAKKERHIDSQESLFLQVGDKRDLVLAPEARMGAVSISSQPFESRGAEIFINNEKRNDTTPAVLPLLIGNYEVTLKHRDFLSQTKPVSISEGRTETLDFTMRTYAGSMQAKANKWKRNTWIGLGASVLVTGGGFYCNMQANDHYDSYKNTVNSDDAVNYRQKTQDFENYRDYCYYAASGLGIYTAYSYIRSAIFRSKVGDRK